MHTPTPPGAQQPDDKVKELVGEYLSEKKRETREVAAYQRRPKRSTALTVLAAIVCAGVWVLPSFVPPVDLAPSPTRVDAGARMNVFLAAQRVVAYQRAYGRLPESLAQAGVDSTDLTYWRSTDSLFEIRANANGDQLAWKSSTNAAAFLGSTFQVLGSGQ